MRLCSACLLGIKCRYDGDSKSNEKVIALSKKEVLIPICPEQLGGLPTPRDASEPTGDGREIINGKARIITNKGNDVTANFIQGAEEVLKIAKLLNIADAILKQKSPSCGCGRIPDGTFSKRYIIGDGVTTALLKKHGIYVISEEDL